MLDTAVVAAREVFTDRFEAAFALGSLAYGGFAPLASDIDLALVLRDVARQTPAEVDRVGVHSIARADDPLPSGSRSSGQTGRAFAMVPAGPAGHPRSTGSTCSITDGC